MTLYINYIIFKASLIDAFFISRKGAKKKYERRQTIVDCQAELVEAISDKDYYPEPASTSSA